MGFKIIRKSDHSLMPWKNGQGSTAQIDIFPEGASFPNSDFQWRLSSATVSTSGPFSQFPGCDRWLVVLSGQGLLLNGKTFGPFTPLKFAGEEVIHSELLFDEVVDLGLIYRRDKVRAEMSVHQISECTSLVLSAVAGTSYLYCIDGTVKISNQTFSEGECCVMSDQKVAFSCEAQGALLIRIQIQTI